MNRPLVNKALAVGLLTALGFVAFLVAFTFFRKGGYAEKDSYEVHVFFRDATGYGQGFAEGQVARYASWPGQATSYWMGRTAILDLLAAARAELGEGFDLVAFHRAVLGHGSVPLEVLGLAVRGDLGLADPAQGGTPP